MRIETSRSQLVGDFNDPALLVLSHRPSEWEGSFVQMVDAMMDSVLDGAPWPVRVLFDTGMVVEGLAVGYSPATRELRFDDGLVVDFNEEDIVAVAA